MFVVIVREPQEYGSCVKGKRTVKGIMQWLQRRVGPSAALLKDEKAAQDLLDTHHVAVVGFFKVHLV